MPRRAKRICIKKLMDTSQPKRTYPHTMELFDLQIKPWSCPQCTFLNTKHPYYCEICAFQDSEEYHIENRGEYRQQYDKWQRMYQAFGKKDNILLPVLSCYTIEQFQMNIKILQERHAKGQIQGVWITSANSDISTLQSVLRWSKMTYPELWIGVNLIGETFVRAFQFLETDRPDGIWMDKSYITENKIQTVPVLIQDQFARLKWNGLYFGGVLFKYQEHKGDPINLCLNAIPWVDVLCTSGAATGTPITDEKLNIIVNATAGNIPIAITSGISAKNVNQLFGKANIYMFRESVVYPDENLNTEMLDQLISAVATTSTHLASLP